MNRASLKRAFNTRGRRWRIKVGGRFLVMEDREDSVAGPLQRTYLAESSERLATQTKKKAKRSVHQAKRARREQETVQSTNHVLESLHKPGIVLLAPTKLASDNCSARPTHTRDARREASYACVFLVFIYPT